MATETEKQITLAIKGMTCASCVSHVTHALEGVPGVEGATVNLATETASIKLDPQLATPSVLADALDDAGYGAEVDKVTLNIGGMTCASCVLHVEKALTKVSGVLSASVNLATEQATVQYLSEAATLEDFRYLVTDAGYSVDGVVGDAKADDADEERLARTKEIKALSRKVIIAGSVGAFVMTVMFIPLETLGLTSFQLNFLLWLLATPVQFWIGATFYKGAWHSATASFNLSGEKWSMRPRLLPLAIPGASEGANLVDLLMGFNRKGRF